MRYLNIKTGAVLETDCSVCGEDWVCKEPLETEETLETEKVPKNSKPKKEK